MFGSPGIYTPLGIQVEYVEYGRAPSFFSEKFDKILSIFQYVESVLTQAYFHTFVHEMGHALALKLFQRNIEILILIYDAYDGVTRGYKENRQLYPWQNSVTYACGPLANVTFSVIRVALAAALQNYISWPITLLVAGGGITGIFYETAYAINSFVKKDFKNFNGDFYRIAKEGLLYLMISGTIFSAEVALGCRLSFHVIKTL